MYIRSLHAEHFRNLADVSIQLDQVNIFVGKVGVGKSNIIDLFRFMRDSVVTGLDHAVGARGGIESVRQFKRTKPYILGLSYEFCSENESEVSEFSYSVRIDAVQDSPRVRLETASWPKSRPQRRRGLLDESSIDTLKTPISITRDEKGYITIDNTRFYTGIESDELSLGAFPPQIGPARSTTGLSDDEHIDLIDSVFENIPFAEPIANHFERMRFVSIYPNVLREPTRIEAGNRLLEDCSNWGSVLRKMKRTRTGKRLLDHIVKMMQQALPDLKGINVRNAGGYLVPQFRMSRAGGGEEIHDPIHLSDGTLRIFGLLLALYAEPRPSLIAIEEPEQTIHPGLLGLLVDAINEASMDTQIMLTTHSPYLLDYFPVDQIRVVETREAGTVVGPVRKEQVENVKKGLMHTSEIMALDGLQGV